MEKNQKQIKFNDFKSEVEAHKREFEAVFERVLSSGWFILGQEVKNFEVEFGRYLGGKHCIGVANGLEALQISLMSLGIGKGDEVITTPISAVATTLAILAVGAVPVFVDVDENGLINPEDVLVAITSKTKAMLPVHLYGHPVDLNRFQIISKKYKVFLIEDACQAHGSLYGKKSAGTIGDMGCFSFYPTKNLGGFGDGGAIVTNSAKIATICRQIRDYGQAGKYKHVICGLNSRLDEIQAALLREKLKFLNQDNKKRVILAKRYISNLSKVTDIKIVMPQIADDSNWHLFVIRTPKRDALQKFLSENGIHTLIHYPVIIPEQPFLKGQYGSKRLPIAKAFTRQVLSLPIYPNMTVDDVDYISQKIKSFSNI